MRVIEFIFKLLFQFISFEPGRFSELKDKAFAWQKNLDDEMVAVGKEKWYHKVFKYDNEWWFQIGLCFVFLFTFKSFRAWLMQDPSNRDEDEDIDDEGDLEEGRDDVRSTRLRKYDLSSIKF